MSKMYWIFGLQTKTKTPLAIYIHGGGFSTGSKEKSMEMS
ncbi:MAG: hypothetical protein CM15mP32_6460 [Flavobacteriaceae bacterium]|nr:MAG: hypothetical protein CM15mP32_6460 [Flavobacteriaceae bacterium]